MICQRPAHKARGLLGEFVGGKVEPSERKEQTVICECIEELDVVLSISVMFMDVDQEYPYITVHLTLFNATSTMILNPEIVKRDGAYDTEEGCLSLLGDLHKYKRCKNIKVL